MSRRIALALATLAGLAAPAARADMLPAWEYTSQGGSFMVIAPPSDLIPITGQAQFSLQGVPSPAAFSGPQTIPVATLGVEILQAGLDNWNFQAEGVPLDVTITDTASGETGTASFSLLVTPTSINAADALIALAPDELAAAMPGERQLTLGGLLYSVELGISGNSLTASVSMSTTVDQPPPPPPPDDPEDPGNGGGGNQTPEPATLVLAAVGAAAWPIRQRLFRGR
jgi:hypothetical protein